MAYCHLGRKDHVAEAADAVAAPTPSPSQHLFRESDYAYVKEYDPMGNVVRYTYVFIEGIYRRAGFPTVCRIQILDSEVRRNEYVHESDLVHVTRKSQYWSTYHESYSDGIQSKRRSFEPPEELLQINRKRQRRKDRTRRGRPQMADASSTDSDDEEGYRDLMHTSLPCQLLSDLDISSSDPDDEDAQARLKIDESFLQANHSNSSEHTVADVIRCSSDEDSPKPSCSIYAGQTHTQGATQYGLAFAETDSDEFDYHEFEISEHKENMAKLREMHKEVEEKRPPSVRAKESRWDQVGPNGNSSIDLKRQECHTGLENRETYDNGIGKSMEYPRRFGWPETGLRGEKEKFIEAKHSEGGKVNVLDSHKEGATTQGTQILPIGIQNKTIDELLEVIKTVTLERVQRRKPQPTVEVEEESCSEEEMDCEEEEFSESDSWESWTDIEEEDSVESSSGDETTKDCLNATTAKATKTSNKHIRSRNLSTSYTVRLIISELLQEMLETDFDLIKNKGKLCNLPARVSVMQVLENWVKFSVIKLIFQWAQVHRSPSEECNQSEQRDKELKEIKRETNLIKEVADGLRICFDFYITHILYEPELKQKEYVLSDDFRADFTYVIAPDFLNPEVEVEELITRGRLEEIHAERLKAQASTSADINSNACKSNRESFRETDTSQSLLGGIGFSNAPSNIGPSCINDFFNDLEINGATPTQDENDMMAIESTPSCRTDFFPLVTTPISMSRRNSSVDGDAHSMDSANNDASSIEEALRAVDSIPPTEEEEEDFPHLDLGLSPMPPEDLFRYDDDTDALFDVNTDFDMYFSDLCLSSDDAQSHYSTEDVMSQVQNSLTKRDERRSHGCSGTVHQALDFKIAVAYRNYVVLMEKLKLKIPDQFKEFLEKELAFQMIPSMAHFMPSMIYGPIHMARVLILMPRVLQAQRHEPEKLKILVRLLEDFTKYLTIRRNWFSEDEYYDNPKNWKSVRSDEPAVPEKVTKTNTVWRRKHSPEKSNEPKSGPVKLSRPPVIIPDDVIQQGETSIILTMGATTENGERPMNGPGRALAETPSRRKRSSTEDISKDLINHKSSKLVHNNNNNTLTSISSKKANNSLELKRLRDPSDIPQVTLLDCSDSSSCRSPSSIKKHKRNKKKKDKSAEESEPVKYCVINNSKQPEMPQRVSPIKISKVDGLTTTSGTSKARTRLSDALGPKAVSKRALPNSRS